MGSIAAAAQAVAASAFSVVLGGGGMPASRGAALGGLLERELDSQDLERGDHTCESAEREARALRVVVDAEGAQRAPGDEVAPAADGGPVDQCDPQGMRHAN